MFFSIFLLFSLLLRGLKGRYSISNNQNYQIDELKTLRIDELTNWK